MLFPKPFHYLPLNPFATCGRPPAVHDRETQNDFRPSSGHRPYCPAAAALPHAIAGLDSAGRLTLVVSAGVAVPVAVWSALSKPKKASQRIGERAATRFQPSSQAPTQYQDEPPDEIALIRK